MQWGSVVCSSGRNAGGRDAACERELSVLDVEVHRIGN